MACIFFFLQRALKKKRSLDIKVINSSAGFIVKFAMVQSAVVFVGMVFILPIKILSKPDVTLPFSIGMGFVNVIFAVTWWLSVNLVISATVEQLAQQYVVIKN